MNWSDLWTALAAVGVSFGLSFFFIERPTDSRIDKQAKTQESLARAQESMSLALALMGDARATVDGLRRNYILDRRAGHATATERHAFRRAVKQFRRGYDAFSAKDYSGALADFQAATQTATSHCPVIRPVCALFIR
jgi:hypothetical protein